MAEHLGEAGDEVVLRLRGLGPPPGGIARCYFPRGLQ